MNVDIEFRIIANEELEQKVIWVENSAAIQNTDPLIVSGSFQATTCPFARSNPKPPSPRRLHY